MHRFCFDLNQNVSAKIQFYIIGLFIALQFFPITLWGKVEIYELFPNTIDDTNLEYIDIKNTGCSDIDISGYILEDASAKQYIFPASTIISSKNTLRINRTISKIILNNVDETIFLKHPDGSIEDQFSYTSSMKWAIIIDVNITLDDCSIQTSTGDITTDTNTGIINSGSTSSWEVLDNTGIIIPETIDGNSWENSGTGYVESTGWSANIEQNNSGSSSEWSGSIVDISSTSTGNEVSNTGIYETGSTISYSWESNSTGSTSSGIAISFPEIIPTIQNPTNAVFSWGFFDCSNQNPCRINVTFDPIFTGEYLSKNYICSIITETGSSTDCNPNTLYYLTGGALWFRLSSKLHPSEYRETSWSILYKNPEIIPEAWNQDIVHWGNIENPESNSWSSHSWEIQSEIQFPEIIPTFQSYTNTTFSGNILSCTTSPCRLNFTLDPIFTGSFESKDYTCQIQYGTGIYNTCNPSQLYLIGTGSIGITITNKLSQKSIYKTFDVIQNIPSNIWWTNWSSTTSSVWIIDKNPPVIIVEFDGKMKSYHEIIGENEMNCYTLTCSINLTAERSYDRENTSIRYLWYYGPNDIKTSKDPGERKYGIWTHEIWLRVIDENNNVSSLYYTIHVLGNQEERKIETQKIQKKITSKTKQPKNKSEKVKIKKNSKVIFFDPPEVILQKSRFTKSENGFICYTASKSCSLNLSFSWTQKWIIYTWEYDDGEKITSKNPKSHIFSLGKHTIKISAWYANNTPIWTRNIEILVTKKYKPKKIKIQKITQKWSKKIIPDPKPDIHPTEIKNQNNTKENPPYLWLIILIGMLPMILIRRK